MHLLVSNHHAEIDAFRRALGALATELRIVENNLSVLSLLGAHASRIQTLVITEHQDEAVNIDTQTFVRNLSARTADPPELIIVGSLFPAASDAAIQTVPTIEQAAALVCMSAQLQLVAAGPAESSLGRNGHTHLDHATITTVMQDEAVVERREAPLHSASPVDVLPATVEAFGVEDAVEQAVRAPEPITADEIPEPTRSLADDIRDWTERYEQQREQTSKPGQGSSWSRMLTDLLPSTRRVRAEEMVLDQAIRSPRLSQCHSVAVISPKGGVGKSFLSYLIGNFLAEVRGDKVVAIDTNPDFGTLADQVRGREPQTVSTLLEHLNTIKHYSDLRRFTSKVESRLEVLAAPADPDIMATIGAQDYRLVHEQLLHYYDTVLFDCGTGFRDDITRFALQQCDQIVLVSAPLFITTGIVIRALGYLNQIGCDLSRVTLAINQVRNEKPLDIDYMRSRFGARLNAIVEIPFDLELYHAMDRGQFSVAATRPTTRLALKQLVAALVQHFA